MIRRFLRHLLSRNAVTVFLLILQLAFLLLAVSAIGERFYIVYLLLIFLDVVLVVYLMNKNEPSAYKLAWIVTISIAPLFGGVVYLFIKQSQQFPKAMEAKYQRQTKEYLCQDNDCLKSLDSICPDHSKLARYVSEYGLYPVYPCRVSEYFPLGELQFNAMLSEMASAKKFIFMEYFIISEGYMLDTISKLLIRKAKEGVDIRIMFDGIGTGLRSSSLPIRELEKNGIECRVFNPFTPFLSSVQNNRDHRKIIVIDGNTAFNGGTNLADEYINHIERFGHWKDTAIMIKGEAVWNYTVMFLQLWGSQSDTPIDFSKYVPDNNSFSAYPEDGFIQPFSDSPLDNEPVGKLTYMELINNAKEYVNITTPYLILDEEMTNVLCFAAKKGVDVRIITPHIPDKWYVYMIAWNNYTKLINSGVKIYEYTPGFIHAKGCIADGKAALIGTINFDYRSFYLHFESAAILYHCAAIWDMKRDFDETVRISHQVSLDECNNRPLLKKVSGALLNMFAPLL